MFSILKMKLLVGAVCLVLIAAITADEVSPIENLSVYNYHARIGIPRAAEIKRWEVENVDKPENQRIVGGWNVDISQYPYQAGLVIQINWTSQSVCGASLISNNRLVTAAHCWRDGQNIANSITVVLGSNTIFYGGARIFTTDVVTHPNWNPSTLNSDIAVIRISSISFTNVIQPISLPSGNEVSSDFTGWTATASGYGVTTNGAGIPNNQVLSAVNIPVMSPTDCRTFFGQWFHNNNICTSGVGGRGPCNSDSGGPLVTTSNNRRILIGVTSYGSSNGCEAGDPTVFARVTSFISWILTI